MNSLLVIGLGNPLMADEGIGVRLVERLANRAAAFPDVEFLDAGTSGMVALHAMRNRRKAIFLDCAMIGEAPGAIRRFTPEQAASLKKMPGLSLHEGDLFDIIELSKRLGECPPEVVIFGIQPELVEPEPQLSPTLAARLAEYETAIRAEILSPHA